MDFGLPIEGIAVLANSIKTSENAFIVETLAVDVKVSALEFKVMVVTFFH